MAKEERVRHSLRRRITLTTLTIFLVSIWVLSYCASWMLREDMERLLTDQQYSTVSYVAAELNDALEERVLALERVARSINQSMLDHPAALQQMLEGQPIFQDMFNSGVVAVSLGGTAVADVPVVAGRRGTSYYSNAATRTALTDGKSVIGRPVVGRVLQEPLFNINTPIRDGHGKVIGALFGVINLFKPNFLDRVGKHRYGKSGGYLVMDLQHNLIVTATDKSRVLQPLPAPGTNEMTDKRRQGFIGSAVAVNSLGVELLSSASRIPVVGWLVVATLPTEEAFAPIGAMQQRILLVTIFLTLLAGVLTWWTLKRQLSPMLAAVRTLATMSDSGQPPQPLPITRRDEIGELIGGFNRLLETLGQREEALKESESRWKFALEGAGDGVWDVNLETGKALYSKRYQEMLGYAEGEFEGIHSEWLDQIHPEDKPHLMELVQAYVDGRSEVYAAEYRMRCRDGSYKWIHARGMVVSLGEDGKPSRMIGTHTDITERKFAETELQALNRDFVTLLENTCDFIYFKDRDSRIRFCSQVMANITGHRNWHDMVGKHDFEIFPVDTARIYYEEELPVFRDGTSIVNRIDPYYDAQGNPGWVNTSKWPVFDDDGKTVIGIFGISRDITALKKAEDALRLKHDQNQRYLNTTSALIFELDGDGKIIMINRAGQNLLGYAENELLGRNWFATCLPQPEGMDVVFPVYRRIMAGDIKGTKEFEHTILCRDGRQLVVALHNTYLINTAGRIVGALSSGVDITERKRIEAELMATKQAADNANLAKTRFLAAASHDLRQPIQAINLFNDALSRTGLSEEQKRISHYLSLSVHSLGDLLNALLDISRLDAGVVKPLPEDIPAEELFCRIDAQFSALVAEKRLRFMFHYPARGMTLFTDPKLLLSLLGNLIGNAIKYTERGGILVGIRRRGKRGLIQIWDTGIGIAPEHIGDIFEEYYQVGNPARDRAHGLGLGLSIVKRLARLLRAEVSCHSRLGRGTVFEISLPLADEQARHEPRRIQQASEDVDTSSSFAGRRIVVIDDDVMVADAIALSLASVGMSITRFGNAEDALANSEIADADFYVSDFNLRGLNGLQLLYAIQRRSPEPIKAILLTGDSSPDRIKLTQSTLWRVLFKPVDLPKLLSAMESQGLRRR